MHRNGHFHRILDLYRMSLGVILANRKLLLCSVATTGMAFAIIVLMVMKFAASPVRSILMWSLFAGWMGVLLHILQPHIKWIGRTLLGSIELMWSVATAFIVPVLIREKTSNPFALVKTSSATVRKT